MLVYATGFDAMTGALGKIDIRGRQGNALTEYWEAGPPATGSAGRWFPEPLYRDGLRHLSAQQHDCVH